MRAVILLREAITVRITLFQTENKNLKITDVFLPQSYLVQGFSRLSQTAKQGSLQNLSHWLNLLLINYRKFSPLTKFNKQLVIV